MIKAVRDTSLMAYTDIITNGTVSRLQRIVLNTIRELGSCTDKQIDFVSRINDIRSTMPRRNELLHMGLVELAYKDKCPISGRTACFWRPTEKGWVT
jgi:hypothetical protein